MVVRFVLIAVVLAIGGCSQPQQGQVVDTKPAARGPVELTFASTPTPPKTGANAVTIAVKQADGTPVTDATVTGEFFMPVMESMGRTTVAFTHQGDGRYTGQGNLTMAGAWQVAVTAKRGADTLATRTFNLTTKE
jgi:nitrogen fixation protein FixH